MRSHNEVIQVRCVEIKLKVNINNSNNNNDYNSNNDNNNRRRETKRRDKTTERELIYSVVLLVAPWAAGPCLVLTVISPFSCFNIDRPYGYVIKPGNAVTMQWW